MPRDDYEIKVTQEHAPDDPDSWYWKLFRMGHRINGGVARTSNQAWDHARMYRNSDDNIRWASAMMKKARQ